MRAAWLVLSLLAFHAVPGRFLPIFYQAYNLNQTQIGITIAAPALLGLFFFPIICGIADRINNHELVMFISSLVALLLFLAQIPAAPSFNLFSESLRFYYLLLLSILNGVGCNVAYPLLRTIIISQLSRKYGKNGHRRFGQEYMYGAVSTAGIQLALGAVLDASHMHLWIYYVGRVVFGIIFFITLVVYARKEKFAASQPNPPATSARIIEEQQKEEEGNLTTDDSTGEHDERKVEWGEMDLSTAAAAKKILFHTGPLTLLFFNLVFWLSGGMSIVEHLLFLFLQNELHASNLICGISVVITVMFEAPVFMAAPTYLNKYGAPRLAILGSFAFILRAYVYAISPNAYITLLVEPLHGVTVALFHIVSASFLTERTPERYSAIGQSLLSGCTGLSRTIGTGLGGYIMQKLGSSILFGGISTLVLVATVIFAVGASMGQNTCERIDAGATLIAETNEKAPIDECIGDTTVSEPAIT